MILAGLKPEIIMEIASRAIAFWTYQVRNKMHMLKFVFFFHFYVVFIGETGSEFAEITKAFKNRKFNLASDLQTM